MSSVELCGCGCDRPRSEIVREVMRDMLLNEEQADAIVPVKREAL